jgi:putative ubiquitin-RnfH superfamily antitoxin RatB of RatAB toxin-antitoxin module
VRVEAVLALETRQIIVAMELAEGQTAGDAIGVAQASDEMANIDLASYATGVYGQLCDRDRVLVEGDRLEFYRPLLADAKERRRVHAREQANTQKKRP